MANAPAVLIPTEGGSPDVAAGFYDVNDETHVVGLIGSENGKLLWRSESLPGENLRGIGSDGTYVFAASGSTLYAYRIDDGSLVWQAVMPDELNYSTGNLLIAGNRVLTLNLDRSFQAYDSASGRLVWSRRINGYDNMLRLVDGDILLFDYVGDSTDFSLIFLDPVDGSEERIFSLSCQYSEYSATSPDPSSGLVLDEAQDSLYLF